MRKVLAFVVFVITLAIFAHYYQIITIPFLTDVGLGARDSYMNKTSEALEEGYND